MIGQLPSWYCPPGIDLPEHVECRGQPTQQLLAGVGPDVDAAEPGMPLPAGGGHVFGGGGYSRGQKGWVKTSAGYWVNFSRTLPEHMQRSAGHPRIMDWTVVEGAALGHEWLCPVLCRPVFRKGVEKAHCFVSALERVWGPKGWQDPVDLASIHAKLVQVSQGLPFEGSDRTFKPLMELATLLIGMGHHSLGLAELEGASWVTEKLVLRLFAGACGLTNG